MPTTSTIKLTVGPHLASEARASVGGSALAGIVAVGGADRDCAMNSDVALEAGAAIVAVVVNCGRESASSLVECAKIAAVDVIDKGASGAVTASIASIAGALAKSADSVTTTVVTACSIDLAYNVQVFLLEVVKSSQPLLRCVQPFIHKLKEPPTSVLGVVY